MFAPYGEIRAGQLSTLTDFAYTGQRLDRDSGGLMYYNARYYLPGLGRFISPDTISPTEGDPQSLDRFSYVRNNPINHTDPTGHCIADDPACIAHHSAGTGPGKSFGCSGPGCGGNKGGGNNGGSQNTTDDDPSDHKAHRRASNVPTTTIGSAPATTFIRAGSGTNFISPCNARSACMPPQREDDLAYLSVGYIASGGMIYRYQSLDLAYHPYSQELQLYGSTHNPFAPWTQVEKTFLTEKGYPPMMLGESAGITLGDLRGESIKSQKTDAYKDTFSSAGFSVGPMGFTSVLGKNPKTGEDTDVRGGAVSYGVGTPSAYSYLTNSQKINNLGDFMNFVFQTGNFNK